MVSFTYKTTNANIDASWQELTERKFSGLEKHLPENVEARFEMEFEKVTASQTGNIFRVEANLSYAGELVRAEATMGSFEEAIDEVQAELDKRLRRANKKRNNLFRRGGRAIKRMMRRG